MAIESKPIKKPTSKELVEFLNQFIFHKEYLPYMKEIIYRIHLHDEIAGLKDEIQIVRKF